MNLNNIDHSTKESFKNIKNDISKEKKFEILDLNNFIDINTQSSYSNFNKSWDSKFLEDNFFFSNNLNILKELKKLILEEIKIIYLNFENILLKFLIYKYHLNYSKNKNDIFFDINEISFFKNYIKIKFSKLLIKYKKFLIIYNNNYKIKNFELETYKNFKNNIKLKLKEFKNNYLCNEPDLILGLKNLINYLKKQNEQLK